MLRLFFLFLMMLVLFLPRVTVSGYVQNCHLQTDGKHECLRVPGYDGEFQFARCSSNTFIRNVSRGAHDCMLGSSSENSASKSVDNNSDHYCWYPCQRQMHNKTEGGVSLDCKCRDEDLNGGAKWTYDYTKYNAVENYKPIDSDLLKELRNCSYLKDGHRICFHENSGNTDTRSQWMICRSSSYVYQKTKGSFTCPDNQLYCWIPCQNEAGGNDLPDDQCGCDWITSSPETRNSANDRTIKSTFILHILMVYLFFVIIT